jgi:tryptophan synthase alpha chain
VSTGRLGEAFARARSEGRAALVGYLPAGYPSVEGCIAALRAMIDGGVDILEIGLPYSDPLIDGPTIQEAVDAALAAGARTTDVLRTVGAVSDLVPTLVMTYWNPVERYGPARFAADLAAVGGVGLITPDLVPEEAGEWTDAAARERLDPVFLVAPSSTEERIRVVASTNRGFIYVASTMGVTGARATIGNRAGELVARVRPLTDLPLAVGLGVSNGDQAAEVAGYADGVVVGSAFVRALLDAPDEAAGVEAVRTLAGELADGVRRPAR